MSQATFHILTGEYPPAPGGVGDYSALLARALAGAGAEVHVWTGPAPGAQADPEPEGGSPSDAGNGAVRLHRLGGRWAGPDLARLGAALDDFAAPRRLVVQHAPSVWGQRGLNLGFCRWLARRRARGDEIRVMFHEVAYPWVLRDKPTRWVLAAGQRLMARTLLSAGAAVDVAIPAWEGMLRRCAPGRLPAVRWRPVPSNIPVVADPRGVAALRGRLAPGGGPVVGSFGTFSSLIAPMLEAVLPRLLAADPARVGLLIGRGGARFAEGLLAAHPGLSGRLVATGGLPADDASRHLQACDLMIQPYPDGVTSRRGSLMAALAHGVPTATNAGRLTEPVWAESKGVALAPSGRADDLLGAAEALLRDPAERARLGASGRALYDRLFAIERTVEALLGAPDGGGPR